MDSISSEHLLKRSGRPAGLAFIIITVFLDMLAMSLIIPVLPQLVLNFTHGNTASASNIIGIFGTAWALMQFIFSPVMGGLSDRFGRRPVILISNIGLGLDYILMAMAPGIALLFIGRIISGITGASMATAQAYISDVSPPEKRAANFGMMSVAFGLGLILGPAIGGLLGEVGPRLPFWVAAGLSLTNACYGYLVLPESLPPLNRSKFSWSRANPVGALAFLKSHSGLLGLAGVHFLLWVSRAIVPAIMVLYVSYRYHFSVAATGIFFASVGFCSMLVGGFMVKPVVMRFGEQTTLLIGLAAGAVGFIMFGSANTDVFLWIGIPVMSLSGLSTPALQGLMTRRIKFADQGQLQGALGSVTAVSQMVGPGVFSFAFAYSVATQAAPGIPFYIAGFLLIIAAFIVFQVNAAQKS